MKYQHSFSTSKIVLVLIFCLMLGNIKSKSQIAKPNSEKKEVEFNTRPLFVKSLNSLRSDSELNDSTLDSINNEKPKSHNSHNSHDTKSKCECASSVKCPPCGVVIIKEEEYKVKCPCAPKPVCPVCPPLSQIHDKAAKKAMEDQKIIYGLRGLTNNMNKVLDNITKYSNDVIKFELKAKEMSKKMEDASQKALSARKNMTKVK